MPFLSLRHAYIGRHSTCPPSIGTEWVGLFRETEGDGGAQYCVERLDKNLNEMEPDEVFSTEAGRPTPGLIGGQP
jgi:hypothetical protein